MSGLGCRLTRLDFDVFTLISHALAFVGFGFADGTDLGGKLAHLLLVAAFHQDMCLVRATDLKARRDLFFDLLRSRNLLIQRKRRGKKTTESRHGFQVYRNHYKDLEVTEAHQAWLADLTYIRSEEGFLYLSLVSDALSRKIIGYEASDRLEAEGCLASLEQAMGQLPEGKRPLHHSDRGIQYCCRAYTEKLQGRELSISMTEENHCYENAQAERLNGILKQEYGLGACFRTKAEARQAVDQAVWLYNELRPHMSLGYRTPSEVHAEAA